MYQKHDTPKISIGILYYDEDYTRQIVEDVVQCLEGFSLFPPTRVILGEGSRFKQYRPTMRDAVLEAYSKKDILSLSWESADSRKSKEYLFTCWGLTFYKKSKIFGTPAMKPWNVLSFYATYDWIKKDENRSKLFLCVKQLIPILRPFQIEIDDVSNSVSINRSAKRESLLKPRHLHTPQVYWGNYWGPDICSRYDVSKLSEISVAEIEEIAGGVYFTLSDDALKFDTPECQKIRKDIQLSVIKE